MAGCKGTSRSRSAANGPATDDRWTVTRTPSTHRKVPSGAKKEKGGRERGGGEGKKGRKVERRRGNEKEREGDLGVNAEGTLKKKDEQSRPERPGGCAGGRAQAQVTQWECPSCKIVAEAAERKRLIQRVQNHWSQASGT